MKSTYCSTFSVILLATEVNLALNPEYLIPNLYKYQNTGYFLYLVMPQDFSGQNLRGRSFKRQNLAGANFSYADIRSADFTGANLRGANFKNASSGLRKRWATILVLISWLLAGISGIFFAHGGILVALIFDQDLNSLIHGWVALIVLIVFFAAIIIRQGINAVLAVAVALSLAGVVAVALSLSLTGVVAVAVAGAGAISVALSVVILVAVVVAGAIAVVIVFFLLSIYNDGKARLNDKNSQLRVIRGGSWADIAESCRSASRKKARIDEQGEYLGFRVVCF